MRPKQTPAAKAPTNTPTIDSSDFPMNVQATQLTESIVNQIIIYPWDFGIARNWILGMTFIDARFR